MNKRHGHFGIVFSLCILFLLAASCNKSAISAPIATPAAQTQVNTTSTAKSGETTIPDATLNPVSVTEVQTPQESGTTKGVEKGKVSMFSYLRQRLSFNMDSSVTKVMNAVKARDIQALESLMCLNIRENEEDLPGKIGELIDAIDGKVTEYTWSRGAGHESSSGDGRLLDQEDSGIHFETTGGTYGLQITWEIANNFAPEELGIRAIYLRRQTIVEYQGEFYKQTEDLVVIKATEGVGKWHD